MTRQIITNSMKGSITAENSYFKIIVLNILVQNLL